LRWIVENLDFDRLVPGHPPLLGTKADVTAQREYPQDLIAAVRSAEEQGPADNSPEIMEAVRNRVRATPTA
jgi:hypothetical protein